MTYAQLLRKLEQLDDEQLNQDVTLLDVEEQEYYPASALKVTDVLDVLDCNHPVICFKTEPQ